MKLYTILMQNIFKNILKNIYCYYIFSEYIFAMFLFEMRLSKIMSFSGRFVCLMGKILYAIAIANRACGSVSVISSISLLEAMQKSVVSYD